MILSRRAWLATALGSLMLPRVAFTQELALTPRIRGMLMGSLIGDAAGGPLEFKSRVALHQPPISFHNWGPEELIDLGAHDPLVLLSYAALRPAPEPYGQWRAHAEAGTITDDSRFKIILMKALRRAHRENIHPITPALFAQEIIDYCDDDSETLCQEWLHEFAMAARWELGARDTDIALPPSRIWGGIPTVTGQMALLPLAGLYAGKPDHAYRVTYDMAFMDNGSGKDISAAIVAGLASALAIDDPRQAWDSAIDTMLRTDPYRFGEVPWVERSVSQWIRFAHTTAHDAKRRPAQLFALLEEGLNATTYWEAHVPLTCAVAIMEFCDYNPLAAMQLVLEFGHDTDSNAQLLGAFIGAAYGEDVFPVSMRDQVATRLMKDYGESVEEWAETLNTMRMGISA